MKNIIKIILFCALAIPLSPQQNNTYHWYKHNKFPLEIIESKRFVLLDKSVSLSSTEKELRSANWRVVKSGFFDVIVNT
jgi:hypothetical protein